MDFLGPDELAVLPVDQLTGYAYHVTERAKDAEARAQQAESKNQQVDAPTNASKVNFSLGTC